MTRTDQEALPKLTEEAIKRLISAPIETRMWNGTYMRSVAKAEFARHSFELEVNVTHPLLKELSGRESDDVVLRLWKSSAGYSIPVPSELQAKISAMVSAATMTDISAAETAHTLHVSINETYRQMGWNEGESSDEAPVESAEELVVKAADLMIRAAVLLGRIAPAELASLDAKSGLKLVGGLSSAVHGAAAINPEVLEYLDSAPAAGFVLKPAPSRDLNELNRRLTIADEAFAEYNFGEEYSVVTLAGWDTTDMDDLRKIVYANVDANPDADSSRLSFHARFKGGALSDICIQDMRQDADVPARRCETQRG